MKVIIIYGGKSAEHEVSILSAFSLLKEMYYEYYQVELVHIHRDGSWWCYRETLTEPPKALKDIVLDERNSYKITPADIKAEDTVIFPMLHGPNGEDGTIQGLFEILEMPYVGTGVLASACGMDKIMTKHILQQIGIPQVPFVSVMKSLWKEDPLAIIEKCEGSLVYPMFVKPANMGSSVGISKVLDSDALVDAIHHAFCYDHRVVVEQGIEAREIEVAVLGNEEVRTSLPGEVVKTVDFYAYEDKYEKNEVTLEIPAQISEEIQEQMRQYAKEAYVALDGSGLSRCDFFLTANHEIFLNEINTMPGFTPFSMYPLLWEHMGIKYGDLIEELIQLALLRYQEKQYYATTLLNNDDSEQ